MSSKNRCWPVLVSTCVCRWKWSTTGGVCSRLCIARVSCLLVLCSRRLDLVCLNCQEERTQGLVFVCAYTRVVCFVCFVLCLFFCVFVWVVSTRKRTNTQTLAHTQTVEHTRTHTNNTHSVETLTFVFTARSVGYLIGSAIGTHHTRQHTPHHRNTHNNNTHHKPANNTNENTRTNRWPVLR